jgi:uncharacterized protein YndB with AHSA1/START domain
MTDSTRPGSASGDLGTVIGDDTIRFERDLPGPIERVWSYLTKAELLEKWLYGRDMPSEPGAEFGSSWEGADGEPGGFTRGTVRVYDPPHVLEYGWEMEAPGTSIRGPVVRFELAPMGDRVRLTLTHRALSRDVFATIAAGWHAHVDTLRAVLSGEDGPDANARYEAVLDRYAKLAP